jgi:cytochrome c oxidase subunit 2
MTARRRRRLIVGGLTATLMLLVSGCAQNLPQNTLHPSGPIAKHINSLFWPVFWIAVGVFFLVEGLLVFSLIKFRHRPGNPVPVQVHGNKRLEITWTVIPALLLAGIAFPTVFTIFELDRRPTGDVLDIDVTAHQFWWQAQYPTLHVNTATEIHIPIDRPVYVTLRSTDVIHSFWVPRLAGKQDVEPGRVNHMTIKATLPGTYYAQCAEFCGLSHANMRFRVIAQTPSDFDGWVQGQLQKAAPPPPDVMAIMQRPNVGCQGCHTIDGLPGFAGILGPNLTHFASRRTFAGAILPNNPDNLRMWLDNPGAVKPGVDMPDLPLSQQDIDALVQYLGSLR